MSHAHLPTRLFLLRHGEVEERYHRSFGGLIDMDLSPRGVEQATALAGWITRHSTLDAIYLSPMKRAQRTAAPLLAATGIAGTTLKGLHEVDFGSWTGHTWEEVHAKHGVSPFAWLDQLDGPGFPGGENAVQFRERVKVCLLEIVEKHPGQSVAVVCHGGVIRMLLAILLDLTIPRMAGFEVDYASCTRVDYRALKSEVQFLNLTPWRDLP